MGSFGGLLILFHWSVGLFFRQYYSVLELWCLRRLLRVLWTAKRSNQSVLKEINPKYSLERLMLKQKHQYFGHLFFSLEKTLILGKIEGKRRSGQQRMRWLDSITDSVSMNLSKLQEIVYGRTAWCAAVHGVAKSQTWLSDWTVTTMTVSWFLVSLKFGGLVSFNFSSQYWVGYSGSLASPCKL